MPRTLLRVKAVPSNDVFCKQPITMGILIVFRWFSSSSLTVPKVPTTIGIIVALTSHNFCACNLKSLYLVIFFSSFTLMFWSQGTAMSILLHSPFSLSMTTILTFGVLVPNLSGLQSPKVFYICHYGWCEKHLSPHSISNFLHRSQCAFLSSSLCLFLYWFPPRTKHELTIWVTLLTFSFQSLYTGTHSAYQWRFLLHLFWMLVLGLHI